jgi:ribosomal protein S18 acetylase RimI-like enzyme
MVQRIPQIPSGIKIRKAKMTDIAQLMELLGILFSIEKDFSPNEVAQRKGLELLLRDTKQRYVAVAEDQGKVLGMVTAQLRISTASGGHVARVEDMIVSPAYRRKGLGTILLNEATRWAFSRKALGLELLADRDNLPALCFYRRNGWKTTNLLLLQKAKMTAS